MTSSYYNFSRNGGWGRENVNRNVNYESFPDRVQEQFLSQPEVKPWNTPENVAIGGVLTPGTFEQFKERVRRHAAMQREKEVVLTQSVDEWARLREYLKLKPGKRSAYITRMRNQGINI